MRQMPEYDAGRAAGFRPFALVCECGRVPSQFKSVGLTDARELVIHWTCKGCHQPVYFVKQLPSSRSRTFQKKERPAEAPPAAGKWQLRPEDVEFLRSIRVKVSDDEFC